MSFHLGAGCHWRDDGDLPSIQAGVFLDSQDVHVIEKLIVLIKAHRLPLGSEVQLQDAIEQLLVSNQIPYQREYKLDVKNRPDFFVYNYAVECKIGGKHTTRQSAVSIYKQCERYASFEQVKGILLITNRSMGWPSEINNKPAYYVSLGEGWL